MKRNFLRLVTSVLVVVMIASSLAIGTMAAGNTETKGYMYTDSKELSNIKYTITYEGVDTVLTFEIDPTATANVASTKITGIDPVTLATGAWNRAAGTFDEMGVTKIVIGEGITELGSGAFISMGTLETVEFPTTLEKLAFAVFESCVNLKKVYIKGTENPAENTVDLSKITYLDSHVFDGALRKVDTLKLNPDYTGELRNEVFKFAKIADIEIPVGVTIIRNGVFSDTNLTTIKILGMETKFESDDVFKNCEAFPSIAGYIGSKAEEFAKANGYTFINIETNEVVHKGTKETAAPETSAKPDDNNDDPKEDDGEKKLPFDESKVTKWGYNNKIYNGATIIETYWVYYEETKTLEFISDRADWEYNETGSLSDCVKDYGNWSDIIDQIEHVVVGKGITKVSGGTCQNMTNLKDVKITSSTIYFDGNAFANCTNLTSIYLDGKEPVEGIADFSKAESMSNIFTNTGITAIKMGPKMGVPTFGLPIQISKLIVYNVEKFDEYGQTNYIDIEDAGDPENVRKYYVEIDPSLPACGDRAVFSFDEATGTLTILGTGSVDGITNYYGGGSKKQPWFDIKKNVKHIVITDAISEIGKYAFCEFSNLETVEIPADKELTLDSAVFEKCHNLVAVYKRGSQPVTGTLDLSTVPTLKSWTFAYDYLIANVVLHPAIDSIGSTTFEENTNLQNIYGTPGSFAEEYATEGNLKFYDIAANTPSAIVCTPPETTADTDEILSPDDTTDDIQAPGLETETKLPDDVTVSPDVTTDPDDIGDNDTDNNNGGISPVIIIVIIAVVVVAAGAVVAVIIIKKKKANK